VKLSVGERIALLKILPREGSLVTIRIVRELRERLSLSEGEFERFGVVESGGMITWKRSEDREFKFGPKASAMIIDALQALDRVSALTIETASLAEKFLPEMPPDESMVCWAEPGAEPSRIEVTELVAGNGERFTVEADDVEVT